MFLQSSFFTEFLFESNLVLTQEDFGNKLYDLFFRKLLRRLLKFKRVEFDIDRNATEGSDHMTTTKSGTKRSSGSRKAGSDSAKKKAKALDGEGIPSLEGNGSSLRPDLS